MTLKQFIQHFDKENNVILLEGKRVVAYDDREKLVVLGKLLASKTSKMIFRSGNSSGADKLFSDGVACVDQKRLQVITPYSGHRKKDNKAYETISLNDIDYAEEPEIVSMSKRNKKTEKLVEKYVSGTKNRLTIKAAYIIRDTVKVTGTNDIKPASFGIFYDDLNSPGSGGTGHTMDICRQKNIPLIDQRTWLKWLKE